jgi:hypothetical protein
VREAEERRRAGFRVYEQEEDGNLLSINNLLKVGTPCRATPPLGTRGLEA